MSDTVIEIQNLSKQYRLGVISSRTLTRDLQSWWARVRKKEDPNAKLFPKNNVLSEINGEEFVWALRDINFNVARGEVIGIIGRNGAGKSTLLKILSRVTAPTQGIVRMKGRIASLLEVGTGFHPELTGRENIYLNGAILGMNKREIAARFEEIVEFSEVSKYIDTPVKRYSSGMYVRLAFAVAAHLEPEILIVDEVLAVGDAAFQKKCLGKLSSMSGESRTVLFVSHNMQAVQSLCTKGVLLYAGRVVEMGDVHRVVSAYLQKHAVDQQERDWAYADAPGNEHVKLLRIAVVPRFQPEDHQRITVRTPLDVEIVFHSEKAGVALNLSLVLYTLSGVTIFNVLTDVIVTEKKEYRSRLHIPGDLLNDDVYTLEVLFVRDTSVVLYRAYDHVSFEVHDIQRDGNWFGKWIGAIRPKLDFTLAVGK